MISGFFSSLSLPSISRLPMLLSLVPGDPSRVVVPCDNSFRFNRLRRRFPHGRRNTTIMASAPITSAAANPMTIESMGVNANAARGRSMIKWSQKKNKENIEMRWVIYLWRKIRQRPSNASKSDAIDKRKQIRTKWKSKIPFCPWTKIHFIGSFLFGRRLLTNSHKNIWMEKYE